MYTMYTDRVAGVWTNSAEGATGPGVALLQQDGVYVAVVLCVRVTQQELQCVTVVTVEDGHQRSVTAQALEGVSGHSAPVTLQGKQGEKTTHT